MGLKKSNYPIANLDITLPEAYAICMDVTCEKDGKAFTCFGIFKNREHALDPIFAPIETYNFEFSADKSLPIFTQAYETAKQTKFADWTDDIVE